jgi:hypothetical protein
MSLISFDSLCSNSEFTNSPKMIILRRIVSGLLDVVCRMPLHLMEKKALTNVDSVKLLTGISLFLEVMRRMNRNNEVHEVFVPEVEIPHFNCNISVANPLLISQLQEDLEAKIKEQIPYKENDTYEILNQYDGIRKGLCPVNAAIKKNDKLIGLIKLDGGFHYRIDKATDQKKLRRLQQLKDFFYRYDYPNVPLIRIDVLDVTPDWVPRISQYCLSQIND